jgi:quinoprotein glucose dehydrogenase
MRPFLTLLVAFCGVAAPSGVGTAQQHADWPVTGGDEGIVHYSTLAQISPANVRHLTVAWRYETHDEFSGSEMEATPVVVDGVLYATTPRMQLFALDAATGRELWRFDPSGGRATLYPMHNRGVTVSGDQVFFTWNERLYALDCATGRPAKQFGRQGWVDLREGLDRPVNGLSVSATSPGVVFDGLFIIGSTVPEGLPSAPGDIRAYDVATGALRWSFHTIPRPGEFGYDSWTQGAYRAVGGANAWSGLTLDTRRGMVFAATGSASYDFFGGNRLGDNLFANSVLALDARTGRHLWHFQTVHHDLWDRDLPAPPSLVTVRRNGRAVDAVAQITKTGHVYLFERAKGTPLFPVEERAVPPSGLPGETAAATQPFPVRPPPFSRQRLTEHDLTTRTPAAHEAALRTFREFSTSNPYDPPSTTGRIVFPGMSGGGEWGGPAFDPGTGLLYVNANELAYLLKLSHPDDQSLYGANCASCHGADRNGSALAPSLVGVGMRRTREQIEDVIRSGTGRMPAFRAAIESDALTQLLDFLITGRSSKLGARISTDAVPYRTALLSTFLDADGYPAIAPPWGTLSAIDLNRGVIRWSIPFGEYPRLAAQGVRRTGSENYGGAIVTKNGLLIIAATAYDKMLRVFDKRTGALLWEVKLPAAGLATPATYMVDGRQFIVIACGGGKNRTLNGGTYVAFALPVVPVTRPK